jgi:hypothetical protein
MDRNPDLAAVPLPYKRSGNVGIQCDTAGRVALGPGSSVSNLSLRHAVFSDGFINGHRRAGSGMSALPPATGRRREYPDVEGLQLTAILPFSQLTPRVGGQ